MWIDKFCFDCKYVSPKECEQTDKKENHMCILFAKQISHLSYPPELIRLDECRKLGVIRPK